MKKWVSLLLVLVMMCLLTAPARAAAEPRLFTDSLGREVSLPPTLERIAVTGPLAQMTVFALAPEKLVGLSSAWDVQAEPFVAEAYRQLPVLGQLYGGKGTVNLETLLAASPQVVIDVGEPKADAGEDLDALSRQTGIPFVHITMGTDTMGDAYEILGELLGMAAEAQALADYCNGVYRRTVERAAAVEKVDLLYIAGLEGLNVIARDSYHSEVIDLLSNNLAVLENPSSRGTGNEVDMEQILNWDPEVILFSQASIFDTVGEDPLWQGVTAIAGNRYYEVPVGPYNWMGFPPSVQRLLGMLWMSELLYPQGGDYDLYTDVARYFELFYHCELTREQYDALVANSIGR